MEIALKQNVGNKFIDLFSSWSLSEIQKVIIDAFDNMPSDSPVNYIGELNKNDIMH